MLCACAEGLVSADMRLKSMEDESLLVRGEHSLPCVCTVPFGRERAAKEARLQALRARLELYEKDRTAVPMDGQVWDTLLRFSPC